MHSFKEKHVISFTSSIFNSLQNEGVASTLERIVEMKINVFEYEHLLFAIDFENNRSLFVVTNCALVETTYYDGIRRGGDPTTG